MARMKSTQTLVANTWTKIFDSASAGGADGENAREIVVRNLEAAGGATVLALVVPLHLGAAVTTGVPGGTEGVPIIAASAQSFLGATGAGAGTIQQVWVRSTGTPAVGWGVTA